MAKRKEEAEQAKPSEAEPQIGQKKLRSLLKAATDADKDQREIAGGINGRIADAVENDHLHKKAFSEIRKRARMTPEKLADYVDTLELYMDMSGLTERAKSAPRLHPKPAGLT